MSFYWVDTSWCVCGVETNEKEIIVNTAPIMKNSIGVNIDSFKNWIESKSGKVIKL